MLAQLEDGAVMNKRQKELFDRYWSRIFRYSSRSAGYYRMMELSINGDKEYGALFQYFKG
jgi:hypothetical protein